MKHAYPPRELAVRLLYFLFGTIVCAAGGAFFVLTETGTDTFGMLMQGVARVAGISNGLAHIGINLTLLLVILLTDRKYIRIGTFVALFAIGPMINVVTVLFSGIITPGLPYLLRLSITVASCVILSFGFSCVVNAGVGMGANDLVSIILSDRLRIQFRWVRIAADCTYTAVGFFLGGTLGLGTIICALMIGPVAQAFMPVTARPLYSFLCRFAPDPTDAPESADSNG